MGEVVDFIPPETRESAFFGTYEDRIAFARRVIAEMRSRYGLDKEPSRLSQSAPPATEPEARKAWAHAKAIDFGIIAPDQQHDHDNTDFGRQPGDEEDEQVSGSL